MTYEDLLCQDEWVNKRQEILDRDSFKCQDCGCIGYHNDAFMSIDSIENVGKILGPRIFANKSISELLELFSKKQELCLEITNVPTNLSYISNSKNIYDLNLVKYFDNLYTAPTNFKFISENNIDNVDIKVKKVNCTTISGSGQFSVLHRAYLLEFDRTLSKGVYITIEHLLTGILGESPLYDNVICITFGNKLLYCEHNIEKGLNVHHTFYVKNLKPWEYPNSSLVTLCEDCHKKRHELAIPQYRFLHSEEIVGYCEKCSKCSGSGYLPQYDYYMNGICFNCQGEGTKIEEW